MAKFIYIDQSLHSLGGHHYDYAINLLNAVEAQGYQPVLGAHRDLRGRVNFPASWQVFTCFRHTTFSRHTVFSFEGPLPRSMQTPEAHAGSRGPASWITRLKDFWNQRNRQAECRDFSQACEQLFSNVQLEQGDHVFFATISEFDFLALADFFSKFPAGDMAQWHLQFHFGIFNGRPSEYSQQEQRLRWVRACFEQALQQSLGKQLHFYNTSAPLVDQYHHLGVGLFNNLPYPINRDFVPLPPEQNDQPRPLRVTCGGGYRPEQGKERLANVLADVWDQCFTSGRMQLVVQSKRSRWSKLGLPGATQMPDQEGPAEGEVVLVPHPLSQERYVNLIRSTDIGLLLYDSRRYYARRAGVLCEFLCAGVPVIVPAGCWLAEQIAEAGFEHLDQILHQHGLPVISRPELIPDVSSNSSASNSPAAATFSLTRPGGTGDLMISFCRPDVTPLTYLRITVDQYNSDGAIITSFSNTVGNRSGGAPVRTLWRIDPQTRTLRLRLQNAYEDSAAAVGSIEPAWLPQGQPLPLASVGLIAADEQHVGRLLLEMRDHYDHYRQSARAFSESWRRDHDPHFTATTLLSAPSAVASSSSRAAAAA